MSKYKVGDWVRVRRTPVGDLGKVDYVDPQGFYQVWIYHENWTMACSYHESDLGPVTTIDKLKVELYYLPLDREHHAKDPH